MMLLQKQLLLRQLLALQKQLLLKQLISIQILRVPWRRFKTLLNEAATTKQK